MDDDNSSYVSYPLALADDWEREINKKKTKGDRGRILPNEHKTLCRTHLSKQYRYSYILTTNIVRTYAYLCQRNVPASRDNIEYNRTL